MFDLSKVFLFGIIFVASFIEFWEAVALCIKKDDGQFGSDKDCNDEWAWAVVAGLLGFLVATTCLIFNKFKPDLLDGAVGWIMYFLLWAIWLCAVAVCTMDKPFAPQGSTTTSTLLSTYGEAGNGYFATWIAFVFSTFLFFGHVTPVAAICSRIFGQLDDTKKLLFMILGASVLEMWHAARICDKSTDCAKMLAWSVSVGAMSTILVLIFLIAMNFVAAVNNFVKYFAAFLALWWISAVCTLTMPNSNSSTDCDSDDPYCVGVFLSVSNGFVGTWIAMLLSVALACMQFGVEVPGFAPQESGPTGSSGEEDSGEQAPAPAPPVAKHEHTHEEPSASAGVSVTGPDEETRA